jgi:tetratricopeptide (TPR) repeat protein
MTICCIPISLLLALAMNQTPNAGEYERPQLTRLREARYFVVGQSPRPRWVTTKWEVKADKPYEQIANEVAAFREFKGPDVSGVWPKKARFAYTQWRKDWADPIKLFRACAYLGVANEIDPSFQKSAEKKEMARDLDLAFQLIENPPKSYLFVRMAYRMSAGNGDRLDYGDLVLHLLRRSPLDRPVLYAAVREVWAESLGSTARKTELENMILAGLLKIRGTPVWRPWDSAAIADIYWLRAERERSRMDIEEALRHLEDALKNTPKVYDVQ